MKGIAHFAVGVAAASCFPEAVRAGADGNSIYFVLGGVSGLLPDTLDFKFIRFLQRYDIEVVPDPARPDARLIAEAVAGAVHGAAATGKPVTLKLHPIRLGADRWQRYEVCFDVAGQRIVVRYGPVVSTGGEVAGGCGPEGGAESAVRLGCGIHLDYMATTTVASLDGPTFRMELGRDGRVTPRFIPWHRAWTHSLPAALLAGLAGMAAGGFWAGAVIGAAWLAHVLLDQVGFMGSCLFYPFRRQRVPGLGRVRSDESLPNFAAVWVAGLVTFWNLARAAPAGGGVNLLALAFYGVVLPCAAMGLTRRLLAGAAARASLRRAPP